MSLCIEQIWQCPQFYSFQKLLYVHKRQSCTHPAEADRKWSFMHFCPLHPLGDFLCIPTPNTGQLNSLFHTFAEFRLIVNRIVARQSTDWLATNAQFSPNAKFARNVTLLALLDKMSKNCCEIQKASQRSSNIWNWCTKLASLKSQQWPFRTPTIYKKFNFTSTKINSPHNCLVQRNGFLKWLQFLHQYENVLKRICLSTEGS